MDRKTYSALRDIRASGQIFAVIVELMDDLKAKDRRRMYQLVRFHYERVLPRYGPRDQRVAVKFLSDDAIKDEIANVKVWQARGKRTIKTLLLEEANYRGLETTEQEYWSMLYRKTLAGRAQHITRAIKWALDSCSERGGHKFMLIEDEYVCTNCRGKIDCEKVTSIIDDHHGQWLRATTG